KELQFQQSMLLSRLGELAKKSKVQAHQLLSMQKELLSLIFLPESIESEEAFTAWKMHAEQYLRIQAQEVEKNEKAFLLITLRNEHAKLLREVSRDLTRQTKEVLTSFTEVPVFSDMNEREALLWLYGQGK